MRLRHLLLFCSLCSVFVCREGSAQAEQSTLMVYFAQGSSTIADSIDVDIPADVERIEIRGGSSSDGSVELNERLAYQRAEAVRRYLIYERGVADSLITTTSVGIDWGRFREYIESQNMPYREAVLSVLEITPPSLRNNRLMQIDHGVPYDYMLTTLFPRLRTAEVTIYMPIVEQRVDEPTTIDIVEPIYNVESEQLLPKPLFAIKTNLLFDLLTMINLEIEVPIKERWSIAAELIFPWWTMASQRNRLQLLNGNIEGRYWWGERANRPILTGWFTGIYTGGGLYDFEYDATGYQGEFFIAAGVSGGYAHTINRSQTLRMEYSVGVGYLSTNYDYYNAYYCCNEVWHAVRQRSGRYLWFGPTRAKVSLSWLINRGGRR